MSAAADLLRTLAAHPAEPECLGDGVCTNPRCPKHGVEWTNVEPAPGSCTCPPHPNPEFSGPGDWDPNCKLHRPPVQVEVTDEAAAAELRQQIAEALSPLAFRTRHPDYDSFGFQIGRQEALERADRVLAALPHLRIVQQGGEQ